MPGFSSIAQQAAFAARQDKMSGKTSKSPYPPESSAFTEFFNAYSAERDRLNGVTRPTPTPKADFRETRHRPRQRA